MIASLQGTVLFRFPEAVVISVGGVGFDVLATRSALETCVIGEQASLLTRLIVREDSLTLFGFVSDSERSMFDALLKVSGVGPKLALLILSHMSVDNLRSAVMSDRAELLTRVPGIGKKTAQKILLELKDKIATGLDALPDGDFTDINSDVLDALISLGFSIVEAQSAIQALPISTAQDTEERILLCLQYLRPDERRLK